MLHRPFFGPSPYERPGDAEGARETTLGEERPRLPGDSILSRNCQCEKLLSICDGLTPEEYRRYLERQAVVAVAVDDKPISDGLTDL